MRSRCMPKSWQRCTTSGSTSTKEPGSSSRSTRSCAVSLPVECWRSMRSAPPPLRDAARRRSRSSNLFRVELIVAVVGGHDGPSAERARLFITSGPGGEFGPVPRAGCSGGRYNPAVSFLEADTGVLARCLAEVSEDPAALVEGFFERSEISALAPRGEAPSLRVWREEGFSIRLVSDAETWMTSRDGLDGTTFLEALR